MTQEENSLDEIVSSWPMAILEHLSNIHVDVEHTTHWVAMDFKLAGLMQFT